MAQVRQSRNQLRAVRGQGWQEMRALKGVLMQREYSRGELRAAGQLWLLFTAVGAPPAEFCVSFWTNLGSTIHLHAGTHLSQSRD